MKNKLIILNKYSSNYYIERIVLFNTPEIQIRDRHFHVELDKPIFIKRNIAYFLICENIQYAISDDNTIKAIDPRSLSTAFNLEVIKKAVTGVDRTSKHEIVMYIVLSVLSFACGFFASSYFKPSETNVIIP